MKKNSMPAGNDGRVRRRMGIVLTAALVIGLLQPSDRSVYAAPVPDWGDGAAETGASDTELPPDGGSGKDNPGQNGGEASDNGSGKDNPGQDGGAASDNGNGKDKPGQNGGAASDDRNDKDNPSQDDGEASDDSNDKDNPGQDGGDGKEEPPHGGATPIPDFGDEDPTPTPDEEDEAPTPTPSVGKDDPTPTPDEEDEAPTPTPDEGDDDPTPTPDEGDDDPTPTPDEGDDDPTPTPDPGNSDLTPAPTPSAGPELPEIPTPVPTGEPDITESPEASPEPTGPPTPTPQYKVDIPWETNNDRYQYLFGMDAREITMSTPPKGYENREAAAAHMVTITVPVWKMKANGKKYSSTYKLTVNRKLSQSVKAIFKEIYALDMKFPIKQLNGFYYRKVGGVGLSKSTLMSVHSFGAAIDINPGDYDNDYFLGKGNDLRDKSNPYCIPDEVIEIFAKYHWYWGGNFEICADTMHFQYLGLEMLNYQNNSPFRDLKVKSGYMKGTDVRNLQQRLCELGYKVTVDGVYGSRTADAVKKYQRARGLSATGQVDYKTWETIINETHYMPYAF